MASCQYPPSPGQMQPQGTRADHAARPLSGGRRRGRFADDRVFRPESGGRSFAEDAGRAEDAEVALQKVARARIQ